MNELRLEVTDFADIDHWRWRLTDASGVFKADHKVTLNRSDPEYEAFVDLYRYVRCPAVPDRRLEGEAEIVDRVGRWIGENVLGPVGEKIVASAPVAVRIRLPAEALGFLYRPLELGHVNGRPLVLQEVSLVFEIASPKTSKIPVHEKFRMLAIISLPSDATALGLRRERHSLKLIIDRVIKTQKKAIEFRIVQYGV